MRIVIGFILALLLLQVSDAATINAASCSSSAIQSAINTASDGDTVAVPACASGTWTSDVTIPDTKGITLQGAGSSNTIINTGFSLRIETLPIRSPSRVTGFRFIRTNSTTSLYMLGTAQNWRIDNNIFDDAGISSVYSIEIGIKGNENLDSFNYGVIDHNQFINRSNGTSVHVSWVRWGASQLDLVASGDWVWSQPAQRGTARAVYIEDNVFSGAGSASQVVDTQYGGQAVVRYNQINSPWISTHSGCTNRGRNTAWTEVYKNTFTQTTSPYGGVQIEMRSTSGVVWGNTSSSTIAYGIGIDHERSYRTDCSGTYGGQCNGTRAFDENSAGNNGGRCLGQPGWGPPQTGNMNSATFAGYFVWENLNNGSVVNAFINNNNGFTSTHMAFGRELFNQANFTGIGSIASRPSTCNPGPTGRSTYVSTDENAQGATIYACSATNVWTKHWEPYTYPHPLQTAGGDTTPPTVSSTVPTDAATGVSVGANITALFSESLNPATVTTATASIVRTSDSSPVTSAVSYAANEITINPSANLAVSTQYTATLTTGIQDVAGNALATTYTWNFTSTNSDRIFANGLEI